MLAMMLASAAPSAPAAADDEEPDTDAAPVPTQPGTPYQPLVNQPPPKGYSPPYGPPPWKSSQNPLATALAGGAPPSAGAAPAGLPPVPRSAPTPPPQDRGFLASLLAGIAPSTPTTGSRYNPQTGEFLPQGANGPAPAAAPPSTSTAALGASTAPSGAGNIAGQVSDIADDATMSGYRTEHDAAITQLNAALAKGDAAAAAGNYEAAKIYFSAAQESAKRADAVQDKAIEYAKPPKEVAEGAHVYNPAKGGYEVPVPFSPYIKQIPEEQQTQAEKDAGGDWVTDTRTGKPEQVANTAGSKYQHVVTGRDPLTGAETYGAFNPDTGEVITPKAPEGTPGSQTAIPAQVQQLEMPNADNGEGDKTPPVPLPPDQQTRLAQVRPEIRGTVESILQGRLGLPKITSGRGAQLPLMITEAVKSVNPDFDANTNQNQLDARKKFNAGGAANTPGSLILNSDAALQHFGPLVRASDDLPNYGSLLGSAVNEIGRATAGHVGGDYQTKVSSLISASTPAADETIKYLVGAGTGGVGEREALIKSFSDPGGTPQSRRASIQNYVEDMLAKKQELQRQWHTAMGPSAPDFPVISDSARAAVIKMGYGDLLQKYGLAGGMPQASGETLPPAPAAPAQKKVLNYNRATGRLE